jgi:hypothetical protein
VPADFVGDEPVIAFSPHYLLDGVVAATATAPATPATATAAAANATAPVPAAAAGTADEPPTGSAGLAERGAAGARVRLWFTSPSKPAVITRQPDPDAAEAKGAEADFRYLVVPQRVQ